MKRVLIVSYYFPPSGGPGVQRVLKFVRYLRDFGWEPVVLSVEAGAYPDHDPSLWKDVPEGVLVHRTKAWDPYRWYARLTGRSSDEAVKVGSLGETETWQERVAQWVRANIFLPDARVGWVPNAVIAGKKLCKQLSINAVLTSGPPHSVHLTGWFLHRLTGTPWVADFRDPWTDINYYHELPHSSWALRLDAALEQVVLRSASCVTTVSPHWRRLLAQKAGLTRDERVAVVQNGFDPADFSGPPVSPPDDLFVLTHVGSLYASRNPASLWGALHRLRTDGTVPALRLRLVGSVAPEVLKSLRAAGLDTIVHHVSYVPHREAVAEMQHAHLLVLSIEAFAHNEGMITGKLYEYLASGRPVVGIGPVGGDAESILQAVEAGAMFGYEDVDGIAAYLHAHYEAWAQGRPYRGASAQDVEPYSRPAQTGIMAQVLDAATDPSTKPAR